MVCPGSTRQQRVLPTDPIQKANRPERNACRQHGCFKLATSIARPKQSPRRWSPWPPHRETRFLRNGDASPDGRQEPCQTIPRRNHPPRGSWHRRWPRPGGQGGRNDRYSRAREQKHRGKGRGKELPHSCSTLFYHAVRTPAPYGRRALASPRPPFPPTSAPPGTGRIGGSAGWPRLRPWSTVWFLLGTQACMGCSRA